MPLKFAKFGGFEIIVIFEQSFVQKFWPIRF